MALERHDPFRADGSRVSLRTRTLKGSGVLLFSRLLVFGIQFVGTIVMARLLTPADFGLVAMVTTLSLLLMNVGHNGFTEAIIQRKDITPVQVSMLFWINLGLSISLSLAFMAGAPLVARFYGEPRVEPVCTVITLTFLLTALSSQHLALLARNLQFGRIAVIEVVSTMVGVSVGITAGYLGWEFWALVAKQIALAAVTTAGAFMSCRWVPRLHIRKTNVKSILLFALNTYGNFFVNYMSRNVNSVLIGWRFSSKALGHYNRAYYLFMLPVNQLLGPLHRVAYASLSRLRDEPEGYRRHFLGAMEKFAFIGMALSALYFIVARDLVLLLLGPQWGEAGEILSVLSPSIGVMLIYGTHGWLHLSLGRADRFFRWGVLAMVVSVSLILIGLRYGVMGVAVAYSASFFVLIGPGLSYAGRPIRLGFSAVCRVAWRYALSAAAAATICWSMTHYPWLLSQPYGNSGPTLRMTLSGATVLILYLIWVFALHGSVRPMTEFLSFVREMRSKTETGKAAI